MNVTNNSVPCDEYPNSTIQVHANPSPDTVQQVRATARRQNLDLRAVHAIRKPKDMLVSAYCFSMRGQEADDPAFANFPWVEFLSLGNHFGGVAVTQLSWVLKTTNLGAPRGR